MSTGQKFRDLVYLQDNHGYCPGTPYLFWTNCDWPIEKLEKLSWKVPGAGRIATQFSEFKQLLNQEGFEVYSGLIGKPGEELAPNALVIKGATGNY